MGLLTLSSPTTTTYLGLTRPRRVASLTTLPSRLPFLEDTLASLAEQTVPFDEIILALPPVSSREWTSYPINDAVQHILTKYGVRVLRSDEDWGPATKLIPIVQRELTAWRRDTVVVVVDDDQIYPREMLETYLEYHDLLPGSALTLRGWKMPKTMHWRAMHVWHSHQRQTSEGVAVVTGIGSFLVVPGFFTSELWNYAESPKGAFYMDDVWISGHLARRGVPRVLLGGIDRRIKNVNSRSMPRDRRTLSDIPMERAQANDEVIQFFKDDWDAFE